MPELPEVEALTSRLARKLPGKRIRAVHVLRATALRPQDPAILARLATGRTIRAVERRGKNILIHLSRNYAIRIHLRMTGSLYAEREAEITPAVRVWFELSGGLALVFRDPRALGRVAIATENEITETLNGLGPEPLTPAFTVKKFLDSARASSQPAKLFLMDQKRVAGLGNIYAAEALFRAQIDPQQPVSSVPAAKLRTLHAKIREVLWEAVKSARITYNRRGKAHKMETFVPSVYGRQGEPCRVCGHPIRRIRQGGRSTYFCPHCQR